MAQHNASGEQFRITGHCQSSCTLFLGIRNVCVERSARLLFHGSHDRQGRVHAHLVRHELKHYKPALWSYLLAGHYLDTTAFHTISGGTPDTEVLVQGMPEEVAGALWGPGRQSATFLLPFDFVGTG